MAECVMLDHSDGIATISLNRPDRLNALDLDTATSLKAALEKVAADERVTAVVITGRGKAFCAGGDLSWVMQCDDGPRAAIYRLAGEFHHAITEICDMRKPVIAAINGVAAGGGFSLALACDFRVLSRGATLRQAYSSAGLSMDGGSSFMLPRLVGHARALEIAAFDAPIQADRAAAIGLATEVADGRVDEAAVAMARRLADRALASFGLAKQLFATSYRSALEEQLARERRMIAECVAGPEGHEGVTAFVEKRPPDFVRARTRLKI